MLLLAAPLVAAPGFDGAAAPCGYTQPPSHPIPAAPCHRSLLPVDLDALVENVRCSICMGEERYWLALPAAARLLLHRVAARLPADHPLQTYSL